jgi:hypothetical protein
MWQRLAQCIGDDHFGGSNAGANGYQLGTEGLPEESGKDGREIVEKASGNDACLNEGMISADFAPDGVAVVE